MHRLPPQVPPVSSCWPRLPPATAGLRIGILGGSFNPAHDGHRHISLEALARLGLDQVWWLVTPGNPLKDHSDLSPLGTRLRDAAAVAHHPRIVVTGVEAELGTTLTSLTLSELARRKPGVRFVWLMGADNLAQFHRWHEWRGIAATMPLAVLDRPRWRFRGLAAPAAQSLRHCRVPEVNARSLPFRQAPAWTFLSIPLSPLSSTALRTRVRKPL